MNTRYNRLLLFVAILTILSGGIARAQVPKPADKKTAPPAAVICEGCGMVNCTMGCKPREETPAKKDGVICKGCGMVNCPMKCDPSKPRSTLKEGDVICEFCGMINCTMGCKAITYDSEYRKMAVMPGIPNWLYYGGIVSLILVSFFFAETFGRRKTSAKRGWRFNLMEVDWIKGLIRKKYFQFIFQLPATVIFIFVIYAGIFGHQTINITPSITWTIWWAGLIFLILVAGKAWCLICPWDMIATTVARLRLFGAGKSPLNLGLKWPKSLRNVYPAVVFFILLTWLELGYHITKSPRMTGYVAIGMVLITLVPALLFEKKAFCRYACLVGRISGLYANFAPIEVRARDKDICSGCKTRDCLNGNEHGNPCPTSLCLANVEDNTYCTMCSECTKSCPNDNVALNLRPFGEDLNHYRKPRMDEAILAIVLLSLTSFHGLTMTPFWENVTDPGGTIVGWISGVLGTEHLGSFTVGMAAIILAPILIYLAFCWLVTRIAYRLQPDLRGDLSISKVFILFAYSMLPIALFYHLAHNGMHTTMEGQHILTVLSDPLGRGWDLFGTAKKMYPPMLGTQLVWVLQVILVIIGHVYGILVAHRTAQRLFGDRRTAYVIEVPMLIIMVLFSFFSLWIMHLDMNMRSTLM